MSTFLFKNRIALSRFSFPVPPRLTLVLPAPLAVPKTSSGVASLAPIQFERYGNKKRERIKGVA